MAGSPTRSGASSLGSGLAPWRVGRPRRERGVLDRLGGGRLTSHVAGAHQAHEGSQQRGRGQHPQRDVHVGDERRELLRREALGQTGEDREQRCFRDRRGDDREHERDRQHGAGVLHERARPGGDPAPVGRHRAHHGGGVRAVEHARADADDQQPQAALPVGGVHLERRHRGEPGGAHEHAQRGERA